MRLVISKNVKHIEKYQSKEETKSLLLLLHLCNCSFSSVLCDCILKSQKKKKRERERDPTFQSDFVSVDYGG